MMACSCASARVSFPVLTGSRARSAATLRAAAMMSSPNCSLYLFVLMREVVVTPSSHVKPVGRLAVPRLRWTVVTPRGTVPGMSESKFKDGDGVEWELAAGNTWETADGRYMEHDVGAGKVLISIPQEHGDMNGDWFPVELMRRIVAQHDAQEKVVA